MRLSPPKVSVVVPAYNVETWIAAAINSVIKQSLVDWELIVVDDGSTDRTAEIVRAIDEPRLVLESQENRGPTAARNRGFARARGQYVALLDADDEYDPYFLQRTTELLDTHPSIGVVATNQYLVRRDGKCEIAFRDAAIRWLDDSATFVDYCRTRLTERCFPSNTAIVLRAKLISALGGYDPVVMGGEELELMLRWNKATRIGYIAEPLATHYDRPGSFIKDLDRSMKARILLWRRVLQQEPSYLTALPGYSKLRNMCLFRIAAVAIAAGYHGEAEEIASLWPTSPRDRFWWAGKTLLALPQPAWRLIHALIGRTDAVRLRNDPGSKYG